jgi:ABC-type ATPase involved in cell division
MARIPEFTLRKSGQRLCTVNVKVHIDEKVVDFLVKNAGLSKSAAIKLIAGRMEDAGNEWIDWHVPSVSKDKSIDWLHVDDLRGNADELGEEGVVIYGADSK